MKTSLFRTGWLHTLILLFAVGLTACESPTAVEQNELTNGTAVEAGFDALAAELSQDLDLSTAQSNEMRDAMNSRRGQMHEPGFLWYLAADLHATLSDEQKERLFAMADQAQDRFRRGPGFGDGPGGGSPLRLIDDLLSADQQAAIEAIQEAYRPQMQALFEARRNGDLTPEDFRAQLTTLHEAMQSEVDAVLTDAQRTELEARLEAARAEREAERAERQAAERAAMTEVLALTDAQVSEIDALFASQQASAEALRAQFSDGSLTQEDFHTALIELRAEGSAALEALLDATQWEIVLIHDALQVRARRGGPGQGGPGGQRGGPGGQRGGPSGARGPNNG